VLADRVVERGVGVGDALGVAQQEWEVEAVLGLEAGRGLELPGRVVDADRPRAATCQPRRDVAGAAAELDGVEAVEVLGQQVELRLGNPEDAPLLLAATERPAPLA